MLRNRNMKIALWYTDSTEKPSTFVALIFAGIGELNRRQPALTLRNLNSQFPGPCSRCMWQGPSGNCNRAFIQDIDFFVMCPELFASQQRKPKSEREIYIYIYVYIYICPIIPVVSIVFSIIPI